MIKWSFEVAGVLLSMIDGYLSFIIELFFTLIFTLKSLDGPIFSYAVVKSDE